MPQRNLVVFLACSMISALDSPHANAENAETYIVDGPIQGSFCRYLGFVCSSKKVDAVTFGNDDLHTITTSFPKVTDFRANSGSDDQGLCWIQTKSSQREEGWGAILKDFRTGVPTFYAARPDGSYEKLGTPDYVVFKCQRQLKK